MKNYKLKFIDSFRFMSTSLPNSDEKLQYDINRGSCKNISFIIRQN